MSILNNISFLEKDQNWADERTNYWFNVEIDGEKTTVAISDHNGELTALDSDGKPIDYDDNFRDEVLGKCIVTTEMIYE